MTLLDEIVREIKESLALETEPVAIKLIKTEDEASKLVNIKKPVNPARYCQMVEAVSRESIEILTEGEKFSCSSPIFTLGFDDPEYSDFKERVENSNTRAVYISPLGKSQLIPDVVLLVLNPRQAMEATLALEKIYGGPIPANLSTQRSVCGNATALPLRTKVANVTFLCGGARVFGTYGDYELIFGIPYPDIDKVKEMLKKQAEKKLENEKIIEKEVRNSKLILEDDGQSP